MLDIFFSNYKWYRKIIGGDWYLIHFTIGEQRPTWWQREKPDTKVMKVLDIETRA